MPKSFAKGGGSGSSGITVGTTTSTGTSETLLKTNATGKVADATGVTQASGKTLVLTSQAATDEPLRIVSHATQSGDLVEATASNGTTQLFGITKDGYVVAASSSAFNVPNFYSISDTNTGLAMDNNDRVLFITGGSETFYVSTNQLTVGSGSALAWDNNAIAGGGVLDSGFGRVAAKVLKTTDGSTGLGWLQTAGNSRVAANVTNSTVTPANITGLSATVAAGRTYAGTVTLHYNQSVAVDGFRFDLDGGTATATDLRLSATISDSTSTRFLGQTTALATDLIDASTSGNALVTVEFTITVNVAGTLIPRFALEALSTGVATVYRGSWMKLDDIA